MSDSTPPLNPASSYDNNNEANHKMRQRSGSPPDRSGQSGRQDKSGRRACGKAHLNGLWSVWYGLFGTFLMAYTAVKCMKRYLSKDSEGP